MVSSFRHPIDISSIRKKYQKSIENMNNGCFPAICSTATRKSLGAISTIKPKVSFPVFLLQQAQFLDDIGLER